MSRTTTHQCAEDQRRAWRRSLGPTLPLLQCRGTVASLWPASTQQQGLPRQQLSENCGRQAARPPLQAGSRRRGVEPDATERSDVIIRKCWQSQGAMCYAESRCRQDFNLHVHLPDGKLGMDDSYCATRARNAGQLTAMAIGTSSRVSHRHAPAGMRRRRAIWPARRDYDAERAEPLLPSCAAVDVSCECTWSMGTTRWLGGGGGEVSSGALECLAGSRLRTGRRRRIASSARGEDPDLICFAMMRCQMDGNCTPTTAALHNRL